MPIKQRITSELRRAKMALQEALPEQTTDRLKAARHEAAEAMRRGSNWFSTKFEELRTGWKGAKQNEGTGQAPEEYEMRTLSPQERQELFESDRDSFKIMLTLTISNLQGSTDHRDNAIRRLCEGLLIRIQTIEANGALTTVTLRDVRDDYIKNMKIIEDQDRHRAQRPPQPPRDSDGGTDVSL